MNLEVHVHKHIYSYYVIEMSVLISKRIYLKEDLTSEWVDIEVQKPTG